MDCFVGIDLGTSSVRAMALGEGGETLAIQGRDYAIREPRPGYAEQSPEEWWEAAADCLRRLLEREELRGARVRSVGLSGQMHGLVLLGRDGQPLRDAIIWPDRRTADICRKWSESIGVETISTIAGLPLATGFMAPSMAWVKENESETYGRAALALLPKDYLRYRLTGELMTDFTDASGSLLLDVSHRRWSSELINRFGLDERLLPPIMNSADVAGRITEAAAEATGLPAGTPVAVGGADIAMAALALGAGKPGGAIVSISTGGTVITSIDRLILDRRLHTICGTEGGTWILMGATLSAGLSLSWFARNVAQPLRGSNPAEDGGLVERLAQDAESAAPGSDNLIFAPYLCGERTPYMDPNAKGCFIGLTLRHTHAHMVRAIMEGVTYSLGESLDIFDEIGVPIRSLACSGGGARSRLWRQILADVLNHPVVWLRGEEHSGIGAAMTGAKALGILLPDKASGEDESAKIEPNPETSVAYRKLKAIYKQVHPKLAGIFDQLSR
jgi:xylulokinase